MCQKNINFRCDAMQCGFPNKIAFQFDIMISIGPNEVNLTSIVNFKPYNPEASS